MELNENALTIEDMINIRLALNELVDIEEQMAMGFRARQRFNLYTSAMNNAESVKNTLKKIKDIMKNSNL